ncbi:MAG TPA: Ig-like domain-containing protein [Sandaracinaceae bacterium LLY-WYZ-13_1]|nr:Ig-like domain-containing protein [Sandaracinaceae bacterium LLY-WYZ-13_1]
MRRLCLPLMMLCLAAGCDESGDPDAGSPVRDAGDPGADAGPPDAGAPVELCDPDLDPGPFPAPDAWEPNRGPGGPAVTFSEDELYTNCVTLDGGELDRSDHHNLVTMYDGYLLMPWAPEYGAGGLTFWDFSDPCAPEVIGSGHSPTMRESHSIGFSSVGGRWAVVDQLGLALTEGRGGVQFWDIADPSAPEAVADLELPGFVYPDAYARVTLSVFWQVPYVYAAGADNGVYIIDAADPRNPRLVEQYVFEPILRVGQVQVVGNVLVATAAEGPRTVLLDVSDPTDPQPIAGGDFLAEDEGGTPREAYFTNLVGGHVYYANKDGGGGLLVYDIRDPEGPTFAGQHISDGNGGYVFVQHDLAFVGESRFAAIYDVSDLGAITEVARLDLEGDLDTATPIGNVVVLSVDDDANEDEGSAVAPFATDPDAVPPSVEWTWPADGADGLRTTSRLGLSFDELVDVRSAHEGSVRLYRTSAADPDQGRVPTIVSAQEAIVNVHPRCALEPNTQYTLEVMAGGVIDFNGNAVAETTTVTFTTGPE